MLKKRLFFGTLMMAIFAGVVFADGLLDGYLSSSGVAGGPIRGTLVCVLVAFVVAGAQVELARLARCRGLVVFLPITITSSVVFAMSWYLPQVVKLPGGWVSMVLALTVMLLFIYQHRSHGNSGVLANCGASCFSVVYLGVLTSFIAGIRIEYGLWPLLMFVFVVKSSDIGAYSIGTLFGRHKFSPRISPGKTWEGMAGAVVAASIVAVLFAEICGIMDWRPAVLFGVLFAFIGQLGDLAESMIKRDAEQKDSASRVPGFGGILDVIDSPIVSAPFAYLFFMAGS